MSNLITFLCLSAGAILGSSFRYLMNIFLSGILSTLLVNALGCFIAGIFLSGKFTYFSPYSQYHKTLILTGLCGALTTFSAFSIETLTLFESGLFLKGLIYIIINLTLSILLLYIGLKA